MIVDCEYWNNADKNPDNAKRSVTFHSLLVTHWKIRSLLVAEVACCKIRSLFAAEFARCKKSLVTR